MKPNRWVILAGAFTILAGLMVYLFDPLSLKPRKTPQQVWGDFLGAQGEYQRLLGEQGKTYAPLYVNRVEGLLKEVWEHAAPPKRDYASASLCCREAVEQAGLGIRRAIRMRCEEKIERLRRKLTDAQNRRAEYYQPELWQASSTDIAELEGSLKNGEYDLVLTAADQLEHQIGTLIYQTRKAATVYAIQKLVNRLTEMRSDGIDKALPAEFSRLDSRLEEARNRIKAGAYEEADDIVKSALLEAKRVCESFEDMQRASARQALKELGARLAAIGVDQDDKAAVKALEQAWNLHGAAEDCLEAGEFDECRKLVERTFPLTDKLDNVVTIQTSAGAIDVRVVNGREAMKKIRAAEEGTVVIRSVSTK